MDRGTVFSHEEISARRKAVDIFKVKVPYALNPRYSYFPFKFLLSSLNPSLSPSLSEDIPFLRLLGLLL